MSDTNDLTRQKDIKKSRFPAVTSLADTAYVDAVLNGQNVKILLSDFIALFGTTGSIEQLGEVTGTPVLNISGTINQIRNIVNGPGVSASLSPQSGVQLGHNFTVDKTGAPIMKNETALSPTLRSLVAGSGISVALQNGFIQIALSGTPVTTKTVIVNEESDFPTAVAGVITLEAETQYLLTNDITTSSRFVLSSDTVVSGSDGTLITLTYSGSGVMFSSTDNSNKIKDIIIVCASGTFCNISCSACSNIFQAVGCRITCATAGTITGMYTVSFQNVLWNVTTDGLTFAGNNEIISFTQNIGSITSGTFVDLSTSTFSGFSLTNSFGVLSAGTTFISGLANSGNVNAGGLATVLNTRALGAGTPLSGVSESDALWEFFANSGINDSRDTILATNAGATVVIAATDTPVIIGATWVEQESSRFSLTAGGRFTYTGKGAFVTFHATITADIVTGTKIPCTFYFFKNGVEITDSGIRRDFTALNAGNFSLLWGDDLETGDYIEVFAENNSTTSDITIINAIVRFD